MGLKIPHLDNTTFEKLVEEARVLIPRYAPQWTDHNLHDPGITFIDLFAWLAESEIYRLNRVTAAHYKKFLEMVGIIPANAQPAAVDIVLDYPPPGHSPGKKEKQEEKIIPAGTKLVTRSGSQPIIFESVETVPLAALSLTAVKTEAGSLVIDNTAANETDGMHFYAFGENAPVGAELRLGFDKPLPAADIHLHFDMFQADLPPLVPAAGESHVFPSAALAWEYLESGEWKPLIIKKDTTGALNKSGKVIAAGPAAMDPEHDNYWLRCRLEKGRYEIIPIIEKIRLNTLSAIQVETVTDENTGEGNGLPHQVMTLKKSPVSAQTLTIRTANSEDRQWHRKEDFTCSGPDDPHYTFDAQKREITFGNGLNGRIPQKNEFIYASYKTTLGANGNIPKNQNFRIEGEEFRGIVGTNPAAAAGGKAAESIEQAKTRAQKDLKNIYRAVTSTDYETLALRTPGIRTARAAAIPNHHPDSPGEPVPGMVTVVAVPHAREGTITPIPGKGFLRTICCRLDNARLITSGLYVTGPVYVKVWITCIIHARKESSPTGIENRVKKALDHFLDPLQGGPDSNGWPFGRPVFPSEIYQVIDNVEGVDYASGVSIRAGGEPDTFHLEDGVVKIIPRALIFPGCHCLEIIST